MRSVGDTGDGTEGALQYLSSQAAQQQPFFMVISLVNPHDVLFYPKVYLDAGYDDSWLQGDIGLPATVNEDLSTKPTVQRQFLKLFNASGPLTTRHMKRDYLNFYGNLMKASDNYLVDVLDTLSTAGLLENTLIIRTSDHGEMGLAHGGLRQKNFNFYEESIRVPLVYSNPRLFPRPRTPNALVSAVDFLPTLARLFDAPPSARADWQGVDYPAGPQPVGKGAAGLHRLHLRRFQSGQARGPYPNGKAPSQWEMYDLKADPLEKENLAHKRHRRTAEQKRQFRRLRRKLAVVQKTRLPPLES